MVTKKTQGREELREYVEKSGIDAEKLNDQELALAAFRSIRDSVRENQSSDVTDELIVERAVAEIGQMREERRRYSDTPVNH